MNGEQNDINANNCRTVNSRQFTHNSSLSTVHSLAFTLAETLIVMGIIGVVAALTIPNVNKNTGEAEKVAKFKKLYAELNEAHNRATAIYGPVEKWADNLPAGTTASQRYINRLSEFLKVQKSCGLTSGDTNCPGVTYSDRYAVQLSDYSTHSKDAIYDEINPSTLLSSGASFYLTSYYNRCDIPFMYAYPHIHSKSIVCGYLYLDIDGPNKGKHTYGIDLFVLAITREGIKPATVSSECLGVGYGGTDTCSMQKIVWYGSGAGQWIMDFGNMDYIYTYHDSYDNAGICKNNTNKRLGYPNSPANGKTIVQSCK